ncbi:MAG: DUF3465 domain-containing protein [Ruminococcus sp.]|jgi:uncharacterized protein YcfL|nr:DUF3465 domain-containing protein [Ruminococcus sp.]
MTKKFITAIVISLLMLCSCSVEIQPEITTNTTETTIETTSKTTAKTTAETTTETEVETTTEETTTVETTTQATTQAITTTVTTTAKTTTTAFVDEEAEYIKSLFDSQTSDVWVTGSGVVNRVLSDDTKGDKHQRFILELSTGQTILFAHNIDIAPRVEDIAKGDIISFYGEYIYSDEGGTIHWTHHDPDGSSDGGWLKRGDTVYK